MTLTAAILLLVSAFTHAGWNLLSKKKKQTAAGFMTANLLGLVLFLPVILVFGSLIHQFPSRVWLLLLLTGFFQAIYFSSLAAAYLHGDISVAYPLARSLPVVFVTLFSLLIGRGGNISAAALSGIVIIVAGGVILPLKSWGDFSIKRYFSRNILFAVLAAVGTAGYSITDSEALSQVRAALTGVPEWQGSIVYAFFEGSFSVMWLAVFTLSRKGGFNAVRKTIKTSWRVSLLTGGAIYLTYSMVLISMAYVTDISYVVAFRQAGIPIGVILSVLLLKEKASPARFTGVFIMLIGLILVGTG